MKDIPSFIVECRPDKLPDCEFKNTVIAETNSEIQKLCEWANSTKPFDEQKLKSFFNSARCKEGLY